MACIFGVTKFEHWLVQLDDPFTIITDAQALTFLTNKRLTSARLLRYIIRLQQFNFRIKYRQGKLNKDADALSRLPVEQSPTPTLNEERTDDLEENHENREFYQLPGEDIAVQRPTRQFEHAFPALSDKDLGEDCPPMEGDENTSLFTVTVPLPKRRNWTRKRVKIKSNGHARYTQKTCRCAQSDSPTIRKRPRY